LLAAQLPVFTAKREIQIVMKNQVLRHLGRPAGIAKNNEFLKNHISYLT
jgi:hypothetical protein